MNKRQTLSQPNIDGTIHALLEQKGEDNMYRLTGRKGEGGVPGELLRVLGTDEEINAYLGNKLISHQYEKVVSNKITKEPLDIHKRVQIAARGLYEAFLAQKKLFPLRREMDIYATSEGKEVINTLVSGVPPEQSRMLFGNNFRKSLEMFGIKYSMPSSDYLIDPKHYHGGWLKVSRIGEDKEREKEVEKRVNTCAEALSNIYISKKQENPLIKDLDIFKYQEGKEAIATLLINAEYEDINSLLGAPHRKALEKYGLKYTRPSFDYLLDPKNYPGGWVLVSEIKNESVAA